MNRKLKRSWQLWDSESQLLAHGVVYREWNVQILWRADCGHTAEQLSAVQGLFELFPTASRLEIEPLAAFVEPRL